ncbi:speckle-type POZ protein-like isoform X2 [Planococcus citri]|uniref:speckle-type POZ protein-like isoform X2 n=1 Tax=Planococcus citri TaxID=170843 RepID=UPI0031F72796
MSSDSLETKCERKKIAKNCCNTKLHLTECSFSWTIDRYSSLVLRRNKTLKSSQFTAVGDNLKWNLEHYVYDDPYDNNQYVALFDLRVHLDGYENVEKYGTITGSAQISFMKPDGHKLETRNSDIDITPTKGPQSIFSFQISVVEVKEWTFQDELTIFCSVSYWKENDIVTTSSEQSPNRFEISESSLAQDFERCYLDDYFSDVTVSVKGKKYPVHKIILAIRSSVFNTMFRNKMQESRNNHIVITDIEQEPFEEMLHYIYTGKVTNIEESAFELLPAADKYDLIELKAMCEVVLCWKLSTDNAARILILADMHRADELKTFALQFIKENYASCEDFKNSEIWTVLTTSHLQLMKDMLAVFCEK